MLWKATCKVLLKSLSAFFHFLLVESKKHNPCIKKNSFISRMLNTKKITIWNTLVVMPIFSDLVSISMDTEWSWSNVLIRIVTLSVSFIRHTWNVMQFRLNTLLDTEALLGSLLTSLRFYVVASASNTHMHLVDMCLLISTYSYLLLSLMARSYFCSL